jgi:ABC-type nickel/cobalt efflux system permease component RcnA
VLETAIVWAQATGETVAQGAAPWAQIATALGFTGLATWLVVKYLPKVHSDHREQMAKLNDDCRDRMAKLSAESAEQLLRAQERYTESLKYEREQCERRHSEFVRQLNDRHAEHMEKLDKLHSINRDVRHGVANVLQSWAGWRALNDKQPRPKPGEDAPGE